VEWEIRAEARSVGDQRSAGSWSLVGDLLLVRSSSARDSIIWAIRAACEDLRFRTRLDLLIDCRELQDGPQPLASPLAQERAFEIASLGFRRCAVVTAAVPPQVGLANMFSTFVEQAGVSARVFLDVTGAEEWLWDEPPDSLDIGAASLHS
jgi:hypothetical protein